MVMNMQFVRIVHMISMLNKVALSQGVWDTTKGKNLLTRKHNFSLEINWNGRIDYSFCALNKINLFQNANKTTLSFSYENNLYWNL